MSDYIERQAVIDAIKKNFKYLPGYMNATINYIKEVPSADVVQVVHSEWIYHMSFGVCKKCGYEYEWKGTDAKNYCPNCGAKMDGERKE